MSRPDPAAAPDSRAAGRSPGRSRRPAGGGRTGRVPPALLLPGVLGLAFLVLPVAGLLLKTPWRQLPQLLAAADAATALRLSLVCASLATAASIVLGVPLAWLLARTRLPGRRFIRALVTVPLILPPVAAGLALLLVFGRTGILGPDLLHWFGISLPFTTSGVVVAETFVALPFLVISVESALRANDPSLEEAAATCGATRWQTFRWVTLPLVGPGIAAGAILAWARALGEFGATITFAGNFPGTTQTMPLAVYLALEQDPQSAIALSVVLLIVSVLVLAALRERWLGVSVAP